MSRKFNNMGYDLRQAEEEREAQRNGALMVRLQVAQDIYARTISGMLLDGQRRLAEKAETIPGSEQEGMAINFGQIALASRSAANAFLIAMGLAQPKEAPSEKPSIAGAEG